MPDCTLLFLSRSPHVLALFSLCHNLCTNDFNVPHLFLLRRSEICVYARVLVCACSFPQIRSHIHVFAYVSPDWSEWTIRLDSPIVTRYHRFVRIVTRGRQANQSSLGSNHRNDAAPANRGQGLRFPKQINRAGYAPGSASTRRGRGEEREVCRPSAAVTAGLRSD